MWILKRVREKGKIAIANNDNIKENDSSVCLFGTTILIVSQTTRTEKKQRNQTLQLRG